MTNKGERKEGKEIGESNEMSDRRGKNKESKAVNVAEKSTKKLGERNGRLRKRGVTTQKPANMAHTN